jgi:two-component system nitrogen regulation sensor histidine kinase NtrY
MRLRRRALGHDARVFFFALLSGLPGVAIALYFLWHDEHTPKVAWTLSLLIVGTWVGFCASLREQIVDRLHTAANLLGALREGDYSMRGRVSDAGEALGSLLGEVNAFGETLAAQRLGALEAAALLSKVMSEIDVAVYAFDPARRLRLVNRAGAELLGRPPPQLLGETADALGMATLLEGEPTRSVDAAFAGARGKWELYRSSFRQGGVPHDLVVLSDLERARREEERQAWQRLVRVLGHEINNSLAPIHSIANNLQQLMRREPRPADWEDDLARGLGVVERRSEALGRFLASYANLARLPPPKLAEVDVGAWIQRMADLETRTRVAVVAGPPAAVLGDADQLDQLLINLVRNAADAALEIGGGVTIGWRRREGRVEVTVTDDGPGLPDTGNLFVPFFTTKPGGSGIGLVLSRQIAEAHHGRLELRNRSDGRGCEAILRLPGGRGA